MFFFHFLNLASLFHNKFNFFKIFIISNFCATNHDATCFHSVANTTKKKRMRRLVCRLIFGTVIRRCLHWVLVLRCENQQQQKPNFLFVNKYNNNATHQVGPSQNGFTAGAPRFFIQWREFSVRGYNFYVSLYPVRMAWVVSI